MLDENKILGEIDSIKSEVEKETQELERKRGLLYYTMLKNDRTILSSLDEIERCCVDNRNLREKLDEDSLDV